RYSATSSSGLNTHCAPMAASNLASAVANSALLTPGGSIGIVDPQACGERRKRAALGMRGRCDDPGEQRAIPRNGVAFLKPERTVVMDHGLRVFGVRRGRRR